LAGVSYADKGPFGSVSGSTLIIRGLNSLKTDQLALAPAIVPAVATYVDETPLFVNLRLIDLDRVEVLRGPQGTLYGSGSLGGTIRFVQKAPDPSGFDAKVIAGFSETSHATGTNYDVTGILNLPVAPTLAVRMNASYTSDAGYINQPNISELSASGAPIAAQPGNLLSPPVTYGKNGVNSYEYKSARIATLWQPTDAFRADLSYYYQSSTAAGYPYNSPVQYGAQSLDSAAIALEPTNDTVDLAALTLDYDIGFATLTSATSWYDHKNKTTSDLTALYEHFSFYNAYYGSNPRALFQGHDEFDDRAWSEELRAASKTGGSFDWVAGLFYRNQTRDITDNESYPGYSAYYNACVPAYGAYSTQCGIGEISYPNNRINGVTVTPDLVYVGDIQSRFQDAALFGDLTWHVTSAWSVTGGARVIKQTDNQTQQVGAILFGPTFITDNALNDTLRRALFKVNTAYRFNDTNLVYATWSQGFRQGGVNALPVSIKGFGATNPQLFRFQPDFADNSEVGFKGTVGQRFRYSVTAFDIEWHNIQEEAAVTALAFPSPLNIGNGYSRGLESEFEASVNEHLLARLGYTYDKAVLQSLSEVASSLTTPPEVGRQLPGTPLQSLAFGLEYSHTQVAGFQMSYAIDGHYQSAIVSQTSETAVTAGGYTLWNARASATRGGWRTSLYVDNLTNVLGINSYTDPASYGNRYFGLVSRPRTIGMSVEYSYKDL
jgi:outer membrane receptor protein involved in Fe transport